jgi:hypothetical protein
MDMHSPHHHQHHPKPLLCRSFMAHALKTLAAAIPTDDPAGRGEDLPAARELLNSLSPRDPAETQLAILGIAAAQAAMDSFARAAKPGVSDETAIRLRSNALTAGRTYVAALQMLRRQPDQAAATAAPARTPPAKAATQAPAAEAQTPGPPPESPPPPIATSVERFQPRDRFGEPIPRWNTMAMTRTQMLAVLAYPPDPVLEAAAVAEEAAMIAEQSASVEDSMDPRSVADTDQPTTPPRSTS